MLRELVNTNETKRLPITSLRTDGGTQMRAALDDATVVEYTQAMVASNGWGAFPAAVAYYDGSVYWLGDGFHRVAAYRDAFPASADGIPCEVRSGTRRDAILHAAGANAQHGLRRTNADKRRSVETLLRDQEWAVWSDNEIARRCNVSPTFVGAVRKDLSLSTVDSEKPAAPAERVFVNKHGKTTTMNVDAIGKSKPAQATDDQLEEVIRSQYGLKASALRTAARQRAGHWLFDMIIGDMKAARLGEWSQTRVVNAMIRVAEQMDADAAPAPTERQHESAAPAWVPPGLPGGRARQAAEQADRERQAATPTTTLDDLPVVDSITVRVDEVGKPNMEWDAAQRQAAAAELPPVPADLAGWTIFHPNATAWYLADGIHATAYHPTPDAAFGEARQQQALWQVPARTIKPGQLPPDLAARGWQLRQVPGSGRWYGNNPNGPRATAIYDRPEDAVAACYDMQRDLRAAAAEAPAAAARPPLSREIEERAYERIGNAAADLGLARNAIAASRPETAETLGQIIELLRDVIGAWGQGL